MAMVEVDIPKKSQRMISRQVSNSGHLITIEPIQEKACFSISKLIPKSPEERRRIHNIHLEEKRMRALGMKIISEGSDSLKKDKETLKDPSQMTKMQLRENLRKLRYDQSLIHQWGVYTTEPIRKNEAIIEYIGELIRLRVADKRQIRYEAEGNNGSYIFQLEKDKLIDATHKGGLARFINHSCTPNCATQVKFFDNENHIIIYAKRDINPYEELCYDYKMEYEPKEKRIRCLCGSPNCKQWLNWSEKAEVELNYKWNNGTEHKRRFQSAPDDCEVESNGSCENHEASESNDANKINQLTDTEQQNELDQQNEFDELNEFDQQGDSDSQNESDDMSNNKHSNKRKKMSRRFDEFEQFNDSESDEANKSDDTDDYVFHRNTNLTKKKLQKAKKANIHTDKSPRSNKKNSQNIQGKQNMNVQQQLQNRFNFPFQIAPEILSSTIKQEKFAYFLKDFMKLMSQPNFPSLLQDNALIKNSPQPPQKMTQCFEMRMPHQTVQQNQDIKFLPSVVLQKNEIARTTVQQNQNVQNLPMVALQNQRIEITQSYMQQNQLKQMPLPSIAQAQDIKVPPSVMLQNQKIEITQSTIQQNQDNKLTTSVIIQSQENQKDSSDLIQDQASIPQKTTTKKRKVIVKNHAKKVVNSSNKNEK